MRRDVGRHTYGDTRCSVDQKIRESGRKNNRFLLGLIEVRCEINGILADIGQHLHGDLAQTRLRVSHGRRSVTIDRTKVAMAVYQRISGGPLLRHIYQSSVDRAVAVRMVFTHGITDDTGTFTMGFIWSVIQFDH